MAQPPTDNNANKPDPKLAEEVKALREALTELRTSFEGQVKELTSEVGKAIKLAQNAANNAASAQESAIAATRIAEAASKDAASAKAVEAKAEAAAKRAAAAETAAKKVATDLAKNSADIGSLRAALGNAGPETAPRPGKIPSFLTIRLRETEFDPIINQVLVEFRASQNQHVNIEALTKSIVENGLVTSIDKVSQALSRSRIPETRRSVLAAAYPALLERQLGKPIKTRLAKDTSGLAQNLLAELELVLDDFATNVVTKSEERLSLKLDDGERKALRARVRESI